MEKTELLSVKEMSEIAERSGEKRAERIGESVEKALGGIREKASSIGKKILGAPEAIQAQSEKIGARVSDIVRDTSDKVIDRYNNFVERTTEARDSFLERWRSNKEKAMEKSEALCVRVTKLGLSPVAWVEEKVSLVYEIPAKIQERKVAVQSQKLNEEKLRSAKTIEEYEGYIKQLREEMRNIKAAELEEVEASSGIRSEIIAERKKHQLEVKKYRAARDSFRRIGRFIETL
ncbi:hypothetical protein GYA37_01575 [candidate division WWE3 bacterium]|uniref:Uncharacterized protein n=1 Tax=candidate division WWE3 bacterium TaxID=2053526 RepID=A0A7X9HSI5_UNCKA|nr:hypothetical protein [candidate division WWE3 bacterium]